MSRSHTLHANTSNTAFVPRHSDIWRGALGLSLFALFGLGLAYAWIATSITNTLFPFQANGSLLHRGGQWVGSALVAQPFADPRDFQPRPSAAKYDPMAATGSNQARSNPELIERIARTRAALAKREGIAPDRVPDDLLTQSGSGLDPHISPAAAQVQIHRVARARGWPVQRVAALVRAQTETPQFGLLGMPRVNVLLLNLALDTQATREAQKSSP